MSTPTTEHEDEIQGAMSEALSAISALCMAPEPVENPPADAIYLCDLDAWAMHAREHIHAAFDLMRRALRERERDRDQLHGRTPRARPTWPGMDTP